jgi:nucleotide-binding universal stress UspA family protein
MKFLVAYNGSDVAKKALELAREHAERFGASVLVITSMEGGTRERPQDISKAKEDLKEAMTFLQEAGIVCEGHELARGLSPAEDLVMFAEENDVDQIYVGIEKKSKVGKLIMGSTAQYIILKAHCPVITTK